MKKKNIKAADVMRQKSSAVVGSDFFFSFTNLYPARGARSRAIPFFDD